MSPEALGLEIEWLGRTIQSYKIRELLGEGGMGIVYRGEDLRLKRDVAIKFLNASLLDSALQRERFLSEAQAAAVLDHPSICKVFDIGETAEGPYIVSAYIEGESLAEVIRRGTLTPVAAIEYSVQLAEALQVCHSRKILHLDLKPSNVLLAEEASGGLRATIIDFGLARISGRHDLTIPGFLSGTITYACPELVNREPLDQRADIWSLGVMLYEMLAGHPPFEADNLERLLYLICHENPAPVSSVHPDLPEEIDQVLARALQKDIALRYQDMGSFLKDLLVLKDHFSLPVVETAHRSESKLRSPVPFLPASPYREQVKQIFLAVCDLDRSSQRQRLEEMCGGNPDVLRDVETLLENDDDESLFGKETRAVPVDWSGKKVQSYQILERIGEGGMGVVYRGEDVRLSRPVAVKFLNAHLLGDEAQRDRFLREAQAAAALNHPSICAVYDIGAAEGQPFIVTAYLQGETLAAAIRSGRLSVLEAIECAIQLGEGLEEAHARGILHRDLKPSNVILTKETNGSSRASIIDFGLAHVSWADRLTVPGLVIGTATYVCPEVLKGQETDARADIWSLGVVLYEMLAGRAPFDAENRERLFDLICNEDAAPLRTINPALPEEAGRIVAKALEKDRNNRYQDTGDLLVDLRALEASLRSTAGTARQPTLLASVPAAKSSVKVSTRHMDPPRQRGIRTPVLTASVLMVLALTSWFAWARVHQETAAPNVVAKRVAVLLFEESGRGNDRLDRAIQDSLTARLATVPYLRLIATPPGQAPADVIAKLKLDYLVTGSTEHVGDTVNVTLRLIAGIDRAELWSATVNFPSSDTTTAQNKLTVTAVPKLLERLSALGDISNRSARPIRHAEAVDLVGKARFTMSEFDKRRQPELLQVAKERFEKALQLDPDYADAMVGLAGVSLAELYPPHGDRTTLLADAKKWLDRALPKDPNNPRVLILESNLYLEGGDPLTGLAYARKAIPLSLGGEAHLQLATTYAALGFFESALAENDEALKADQLKITPFYFEVEYLVLLHRFKEAENVIGEMRKLDHKGPALAGVEGLLALNRGEYQKARKILEASPAVGLTIQETYEVYAALARTAAGDTSVGKAVLDKYSAAGVRELDTLILLAAVVGDADTMVRMTRESTSFNSYGWLVRNGGFLKKVARKPAFRKLVLDLHHSWEANLATVGSSLPVRPSGLPTPAEFLSSLR